PAGAPEDLHMLRTQSDILVEFPVHGLLGRLAVLDAALGKMPGMLADALAPEHLVARIDQNDADVRAKAFTIKHDEPSNSVDWCRFFHACARFESAPAAHAAAIRQSMRGERPHHELESRARSRL